MSENGHQMVIVEVYALSNDADITLKDEFYKKL